MNPVASNALWIPIGLAVIWIGEAATKPFGYFLEGLGLVMVLGAAINIIKIRREQDPGFMEIDKRDLRK